MTGPEKNASKGFIVLSDSAGHGEFQKKSVHKSDPGKRVNLHISKMAANESNTKSIPGPNPNSLFRYLLLLAI